MKARISAGWERRNAAVIVGRALFGACLLVVMMLRPTIAASQEASSRDQSANVGEDLFRPPSNLFQMMTYYRTAPGSGSTNGSIANVTTETLNLRYDHALDLAPMWILALRSDLPLLAKNPISSSNPDGDYLYGVGDADVQAVVIRNLNQRWAVGFGARLIAPTGGDTFGSENGRLWRLSVRVTRCGRSIIQLYRADRSIRRQFRRRSDNEKYQQPAICADLQPGPPGPMVHYLLSEPRHPDKFGRSGHRTERAAVPSVRRQNRTQIVG
jgi:hypothetical protein